MALVPHNFDLPFNIQRCSHVHCIVTDLDESRRFYVDIMGMIETERTNNTTATKGYQSEPKGTKTIVPPDGLLGQRYRRGQLCDRSRHRAQPFSSARCSPESLMPGDRRQNAISRRRRVFARLRQVSERF